VVVVFFLLLLRLLKKIVSLFFFFRLKKNCSLFSCISLYLISIPSFDCDEDSCLASKERERDGMIYKDKAAERPILFFFFFFVSSS